MKLLPAFLMLSFCCFPSFADTGASGRARWTCVAEGYDSNNFPIPVYGDGSTKEEAWRNAFTQCSTRGYRSCRPAGCNENR